MKPNESDETADLITRPEEASASPDPVVGSDAPRPPVDRIDSGANGPPLAAVFRRRNAGASGRRASTAPPAAAAVGLTVTNDEKYDVVLTDAFRVETPAGGTLRPELHGPPTVEATPPLPPSRLPPAILPAAFTAGEAAAPEFEIEDSLETDDDTAPPVRWPIAELPINFDPVLAVDAVLSVAQRHATSKRTPTAGSWFAELFSNDYFLASPARFGPASEREVEFIDAALSVPAGGRLLDLACGAGRHALLLAARGYDLVGLDMSLDMLKRALVRAQAESLAIKFVHGDMRDLNFSEAFDGVISFDTSFGFFTEAENLMVLRGVHLALKKGGRFLIDVANRDCAIRGLPTRNWWEGEGCLVQEDIEFDHVASRLSIKRFCVFADGMQREFNISIRLYAPHELQRLLELAGFEVLELSGSRHTRRAYLGPESPRLIFVAQRPNL